MEEEKPKKKRKNAPIKREPSSSLEMAEREETRPKVKKAAEEGEKEHKKPWQEKYASPEQIESPRDRPFNYEGIYSQAYALYQEGFEYWFSPKEIRQLSEHNSQFETPKDELELVDYYFRHPIGADTGEFMPTAIAKQIVSSPGMNVSTVALGRAFKKLGFRDGIENRCRGFYVVRRPDEERRTRARSLAYEAAKSDTQITDDTDVY